MDISKMDMPEYESDELDLGLEEMELPGESEDAEIAEMISKLEELGYKVEKISEEVDNDMPEADEIEDL